MKTRRLGRTGIEVTRMGLGLAALGRPGYINLGHHEDTATGRSVEAMETRCHQVLDTAWALGIRYFDAARSYGLAERFLSTWLKNKEAQPTVASKWGYTYTADWQVEAEVHEVKEHSLTVLERQWRESRDLLDGHIDLYQIHSATFESGVFDNAQVLDALARIKSDGVSIGFTTSGPRQSELIHRALEIEVDGLRLFDTAQSTWNLLEPSAGPALQEAHDAGLGIIIKEALANGRLTARNQEEDFAAKRAVLEETADALAASLDTLSLAVALAHPWADVVLSGASTVEQLSSNVIALDLDLPPHFMHSVAALTEAADDYWKKRIGLSWN